MDAAQVARVIREAWLPVAHSGPGAKACAEPFAPRPLESLLCIAFEASLLREENRPLSFRIIVQSPEKFPPSEGPPEGFHRLIFSTPRPLSAAELRRLTPAADYDRSLVGVRPNEQGHLEIWGLIQSGPRWLEQFQGGRGNAFELPPALIIGVNAPGYMTVSQGSRPICAIEAGVLQSDRLNVFTSHWLPDSFAPIRQELRELHAADQAKSHKTWTTIDADLTKMVAQQMIQRLISTVQRSGHGGMLLIIPPHRAQEMTRKNPWVNLKFTFQDEEPRSRFRSLIVQVMQILAASGSNEAMGKTSVGWEDYGRSLSRELANLNEAIFEMSYMIANLTQVDGAVVLTKRFELLGFGGEIAGALPEVDNVAKALDLEGDMQHLESVENVGTRHRTVYRLCNALPDMLGIVVSQDGGTRFVRWKDPHVTYWRHTTIASS